MTQLHPRIIARSINLAALSVLGFGLVAAGCDRTDKVVVNEPQQQPQPQQSPAPVQAADDQTQYADVQQAPPPPLVEVQPPAPSSASVWIDGYWNWDNRQYKWQAGRYSRPPEPDMVWVAPRYTSDAHGNRYSQGQWTKQNHGDNRVPPDPRGQPDQRDHPDQRDSHDQPQPPGR
jgi:hypothetical protein